MRRAVPFLLVGLLVIGTVVGLIVGIANEPRGITQAVATQPACSLLTLTEATHLLEQAVANPGLENKVFCSYQGEAPIEPGQASPVVSVSVLTNLDTVADIEAVLDHQRKIDCAVVPAGTACAGLVTSRHFVTVDGVPALWSQTTSTASGHVGAVVAAKDGFAVLIAVAGPAHPVKVALSATGDVLARL